MGVLISVPATLGYVYAGWGKPGLPSDAIGYISTLAFLCLLPTSFLTARLGVSVAHQLSKRRLEVLFGLFLLLVCSRFVYDFLAA